MALGVEHAWRDGRIMVMSRFAQPVLRCECSPGRVSGLQCGAALPASRGRCRRGDARGNPAAGAVLVSKNVPKILVLFVLGMAGIGLCGCGRPKFEMGTVTGRVTLGGIPLQSGAIYFLPQHAMAAVGNIGPDGRYELRSRRSGDGAAVGRHRVFIKQAVEEGVSRGPAVPQRYEDVTTSGWEVEVKPGKNVFDFDIPAVGTGS